MKNLKNFMDRHLIKIVLILALVFGVALGMINNQPTAQAQGNGQNFVIQAGGNGPVNAEVLAFAPQSLQVHRGDTVSWVINGFHNIRFDNAPIDLVIAPEVDGQPLPQFNPAIAFPTIGDGAAYQGGVVNSGLPLPGNPGIESGVFSLIMDVPPGVYAYVCDVHPGMLGVINVVGDDTEIPDPIEASIQGAAQLAPQFFAADALNTELELAATDTGEVQAGAGSGRLVVKEFYPFATVIQAGESVTWTIPADHPDPHTVTWPPSRGQDVAPIPQEEGPPILALGPTTAPLTPSGSEVGLDDEFSSGLFFPGQSYTLTFTEPGTYPYVCNIHPGMSGAVVVLPAEEEVAEE